MSKNITPTDAVNIIINKEKFDDSAVNLAKRIIKEAVDEQLKEKPKNLTKRKIGFNYPNRKD